MISKAIALQVILALSISATPVERRASFSLSNGQQAQQLNAQFASLTADSSCTAGQNACVQGQFAQCVNGKFEMTACAGGLQCVALPLVNSPGTSVTCDTQADAEARIAASGATGGLTAREIEPHSWKREEDVGFGTLEHSKRASFSLSNGQAAQKLNAQFASMTASSSCQAGQNACVQGQFAQCVNGKFVMTPCAGGLQCVALPLVNSPGTSITCDTQADAETRVANTGATGGLTGTS